VREESHLDDMRAAIRGDFERLQERRGEQELMRVGEPDPHPEPEPEPKPAPAPEPEPEPDSSEDALPHTAPAAEPELAAEAHQAPTRRPWLDRLLGR
jgi:hypothetical protein